MKNCLHRVLVVAISAGSLFASNAARAERDIVYSARYYLKPGVESGGKKTSRFHLFRINADGSRRTQITFGAHDDKLPLWSPDGKRLVFLRDDKTLFLADANGKNVVKLLDLGADDSYWDGLRWSPDSKIVGFIHHATIGKSYVDTLHLTNIKTRKATRIAAVDRYAWSPDNRKLILSDSSIGLRVLDWPSRKLRALAANISKFAWLSNEKWVGTISETAPDDEPLGIRKIVVLNAAGETLKTFDLAKNSDGDYADWRSYVAPIPNSAQTFQFSLDESTSSGHEDIYFRASAVDGHMTRLARGEDFAWAPDGRRFLLVTYHDTPPYDTLPNGRKRVVYATKLQVGTGEKNLRTLVSGLVYVQSADWRRTPKN